MLTQFSRTELLLGENAMQRLFSARAAVFGSGAAAEFAAEAFARSGIGSLAVYENAALAARLVSINPDLKLDIITSDSGAAGCDCIIDTTGNAGHIARLAEGDAFMVCIADELGYEVTTLDAADIGKLKTPFAAELRKMGINHNAKRCRDKAAIPDNINHNAKRCRDKAAIPDKMQKLRCVYSTEPQGDTPPHVIAAAGLIAAAEAVRAVAAAE